MRKVLWKFFGWSVAFVFAIFLITQSWADAAGAYRAGLGVASGSAGVVVGTVPGAATNFEEGRQAALDSQQRAEESRAAQE